MTKGYFITGTDTGVGKTVVATILGVGLRGAYWKPVQTGVKEGRDTDFVRRYGATTYPEVYALQEPLSPHAAARIENIEISLSKIVSSRPETSRPLIVEGAGGVLVPLNAGDFMIDLIERLRLPTIIVCRSTLGTINHSILTIRVLEQRGISIAGLVLVGAHNPQNRAALEKYGRVRVLGEVLPAEKFSRAWMTHEFGKFDTTLNPARGHAYDRDT